MESQGINLVRESDGILLMVRDKWYVLSSVIFVNENENGEKRENNEFVNEN